MNVQENELKPILVLRLSLFARFVRAPWTVLFLVIFIGVGLFIIYDLYKGEPDQNLKMKAIIALVGIAGLLFRLPDLLFNVFIDTLSEEKCLILRKHDFKDTRISDLFIRWEDVEKIEKWTSSGYFRGLVPKLRKPCVFKASYSKVFVNFKIFSKYSDPGLIYVHLRTLPIDRRKIVADFFDSANIPASGVVK